MNEDCTPQEFHWQLSSILEGGSVLLCLLLHTCHTPDPAAGRLCIIVGDVL